MLLTSIQVAWINWDTLCTDGTDTMKKSNYHINNHKINSRTINFKTCCVYYTDSLSGSIGTQQWKDLFRGCVAMDPYKEYCSRPYIWTLLSSTSCNSAHIFSPLSQSCHTVKQSHPLPYSLFSVWYKSSSAWHEKSTKSCEMTVQDLHSSGRHK
jgi:hypothetical protein